MSLPVVTLWASSAVFATFGGWLLVQPSILSSWLSLDANSPAAVTEIRAFYGGLELGIAAFCAYCALSPERLNTGLVGVLCLVGGIAAARCFGMWIDGSTSGQTLAFLGTELVLVILAGVAWARLPN